MDFIRYRVTDADDSFLDSFTTNAPDFAEERIGAIRDFHPDLKVEETEDN